MLPDTPGNLLEVVVLAANRPDLDGLDALMAKVRPQGWRRLGKLWADNGYQSAKARVWLWNPFQIDLEIVRPSADQAGFAVQPRRWVVERTFAWFNVHRRLSKDYERCPLSSAGMLYLASLRTLLRRLSD